MNEYIAYCGLDCEACEARIATVNNDAELRQRVVGTERRGDHAGDDKLRRLPDRRGQDALLRIALPDPSVCHGERPGDLRRLRGNGAL